MVDWFSWNDETPLVQAVSTCNREFFAINWQLEHSSAESKSRLLLDSDRTIDLQYYWNRLKDPVNSDPAFFDSEAIPASIKLGDHDGIDLPWFTNADAALLYWEIHHETELAPLRLRVEIDHIEVWIDSSSEGEKYGPWTPTDEPLLALYNSDGFNSTPIQIKFPNPIEVVNSSPSRTFPLRKAIQSVLVPTGLFIHRHSGFVALGLTAILQVIDIAFKLLAIYSLVVFVCWVAYGKPNFILWLHSFWMTRYVAVMLPFLKQDPSATNPDLSSNEEADTSKRQPQPLRGIGDFFRSPSPLDDFFVTFESTRYMVEPIRFRHGQGEDNGRAQVSGVPNDIKFNVSLRSSRTETSIQRQQHDLEMGGLADRSEK